eukprot:SAG31_NODE_2017_length_6663_cov_3.680530_2_plen_57_part_00
MSEHYFLIAKMQTLCAIVSTSSSSVVAQRARAVFEEYSSPNGIYEYDIRTATNYDL